MDMQKIWGKAAERIISGLTDARWTKVSGIGRPHFFSVWETSFHGVTLSRDSARTIYTKTDDDIQTVAFSSTLSPSGWSVVSSGKLWDAVVAQLIAEEEIEKATLKLAPPSTPKKSRRI